MKRSECVASMAWNAPSYDLLWWTPFLKLLKGLGNSKPHSVAQTDRETALNLLLDVLALSSQQGRALHAVHSVVCFHTKPCLCRLGSVSPSGGIIGHHARSCSTPRRSWQHCQPPAYFLLYFSILRQQSCPMRHLKVDEKYEASSQRFLAGHMFLRHCLMVGLRGDIYMTFPEACLRNVHTSFVVLLWLLSVWHICFRNIPLLRQLNSLFERKLLSDLVRFISHLLK